MATINLKRTGGILADGLYKARIHHMEERPGKAAPYFQVQLKIEKGNSLVFDNVSMSENARFRLEAFLDALQAPTSGNMTVAKLIAFCRNKAVWVVLGNESYEGKLKNTVKQWLTPEVAAQMQELEPATKDVADEDIEEDEEGEWPDSDDEDDDDDDETGSGLPF